jgi:hypothetical protein
MKVAITNGSKLNQHPFGGTGTRIGQQNWFFFWLEQKFKRTSKNNS